MTGADELIDLASVWTWGPQYDWHWQQIVDEVTQELPSDDTSP